MNHCGLLVGLLWLGAGSLALVAEVALWTTPWTLPMLATSWLYCHRQWDEKEHPAHTALVVLLTLLTIVVAPYSVWDAWHDHPWPRRSALFLLRLASQTSYLGLLPWSTMGHVGLTALQLVYLYCRVGWRKLKQC